MPKTIRQTVTFKASPHEVYEALMNSRRHAKFSGGKARLSRKVGGKFTAYDGYIEGTNLELAPDKKIVPVMPMSLSFREGFPKNAAASCARAARESGTVMSGAPEAVRVALPCSATTATSPC